MVTVPGKVLITGGYLVLDGYKGIVVGTEARFTSEITDSNFNLIESCQFDTKYLYSSPQTASPQTASPLTASPLTASPLTASPLTDLSGKSELPIEAKLPLDAELPLEAELPTEVIDSKLNLFIHFPILIIKSLVKLKSSTMGGFHIKIFADNDFYSQQPNITGMYSLHLSPPSSPCQLIYS
jgi:hypothetical protein